MEPNRGGLIRPLLCVERREIMEWLRAQELSWCEDSTNQEENYTRNPNHLIFQNKATNT